MEKVVINVMPPIITKGFQNFKSEFSNIREEKSESLSNYSALDNPVEVPCQVEAYILCRDKYIKPTDSVLDVGFGLGYGLHIIAGKAKYAVGLEVDKSAVNRAERLFKNHPFIKKIILYDGEKIPFEDKSFDVVVCSEVIEHVEDYKQLLLEMARVSRNSIFISTPNRRHENTLNNGKPKNYWHLREWTKDELDIIFKELGFTCEWNFINGCFEGPFTVTTELKDDTFSLIPVIKVSYKERH